MTDLEIPTNLAFIVFPLRKLDYGKLHLLPLRDAQQGILKSNSPGSGLKIEAILDNFCRICRAGISSCPDSVLRSGASISARLANPCNHRIREHILDLMPSIVRAIRIDDNIFPRSTGSAFIGSTKEGVSGAFAFTLCQYTCDERAE